MRPARTRRRELVSETERWFELGDLCVKDNKMYKLNISVLARNYTNK